MKRKMVPTWLSLINGPENKCLTTDKFRIWSPMATPILAFSSPVVLNTPYGRLSKVKSEPCGIGTLHVAMISKWWN